jgi:branched-chain amino acid transport system ATP-binding protein
MDIILETVDLSRAFGGLAAVRDVNVRIYSGEFVGIVGANGAGKTTFLNLVTGYLKPDYGRILYRAHDGEGESLREITGLSPQAVTRRGIARSFQVPQLYSDLSVLENVLLAVATGSGKSRSFWQPLREPRRMREAGDVLERFALTDYADEPVSMLPEGRRKLLDVALSFTLRPRLLLMDEPTSGVSNADKLAVMDALAVVLSVARVTTVFVEHDMEIVERYAHRVLAFVGGRVVADGRPEVVLADSAVCSAVLGV